jgi:hypothetical protein
MPCARLRSRSTCSSRITTYPWTVCCSLHAHASLAGAAAALNWQLLYPAGLPSGRRPPARLSSEPDTHCGDPCTCPVAVANHAGSMGHPPGDVANVACRSRSMLVRGTRVYPAAHGPPGPHAPAAAPGAAGPMSARTPGACCKQQQHQHPGKMCTALSRKLSKHVQRSRWRRAATIVQLEHQGGMHVATAAMQQS